MIFRKGILILAAACSSHLITAQSLEELHTRGLQQNPPGVTLTVESLDADRKFHLSDRLQFRLFFKSENIEVYTLELKDGNAASVSDEITFQSAEMTDPIRTTPGLLAVVCCDSYRQYVGKLPRSVRLSFTLENVQRGLNWRLHRLETPPIEKMKPGEYKMFVQTKRLMRGWPKSSHDTYHEVSDIVVTSSNIVTFSLLPDVPQDKKAKP